MKNGDNGLMVAKSADPEQMAVLDNVLSLVNELRSMGDSQDGMTPGLDGEGGEGQDLRVAQSEDDGMPPEDDASMSPAAPQRPKLPAPPMRPTIAKSIQASSPDGETARSDAEDRIGGDDVPDTDDENEKEVEKDLKRIRKALRRMGYDVVKAAPASSPVRKSMGSQDSAIDRLSRQVAAQSAMIGEMLEGIGVAGGLLTEAPAADRDVRKSADRRPQSSYSNEDLVAAVAQMMGVKKSAGNIDDELGLDMDDPWERGRVVHKSMVGFTDAFGKAAGGIWSPR